MWWWKSLERLVKLSGLCIAGFDFTLAFLEADAGFVLDSFVSLGLGLVILYVAVRFKIPPQ